jgi:glycosyltransferase involved in cell wall biosynthesis
MKILLIGEYSSFHRNLKIGLKQNGIDAIVAGSDDGFKKIEVDINLFGNYSGNKVFKFLAKQNSIYNKTKKLKNFDIVQFINPFLFISKYQKYALAYNKLIYNNIEKNNNNLFLSSCGNDAVLVQIGKNLLEYNIIDPSGTDVSGIKITPEALKWNLELVDKCKGVIPAGYSYWTGYNKVLNDKSKLSKPIPPAIVCDEFEFSNNINGKLKIFHGINQPKLKGSPLILEAMNKIKERYPNDIELIVVKRLAYKDYLKQLAHANVNIDQAYSYAYGLNALISMAMGKITLSGAEPIALEAIKVENCPVVNIKPQVEDIYKQLETLLERKNELNEISQKTRSFVEKYHDSKIIAKQYFDYWISKS